jgi:PAS domain S-box-containing protein
VDTVVRLRAEDPIVPIVVLTDVEKKGTALQAIRAGAEDCLFKSELEPKLLVRTIRHAIERAAHHQASKRLQDEETRYRHLLEANTSYTYSVTFADGATSTRHSPGCLATTGYSPDEYAADAYLWICMVHPDDQAMVQQYVAGVMKGEKLPPIEHRIIHKDGRTRWIRNTIIHHCDERGRLLGYDGVVEDISQRKEAEDKLTYLASFPERNPQPVMELSLTGDIRYLNPAAQSLLPGLREQGLAHPWLVDWANLVRQVFMEPAKDTIREVAVGDRRYQQHITFIVPDKAIRIYAADITERKWAETERERMLAWQQDINALQQLLLAPAPLEDKLKTITDSIVRLFEADFCRIWLIRPGDLCEHGCLHARVEEGLHVCRNRERCLHLLASSGRYTHTDSKVHSRVPFGAYKIGRVASGENHKFLTNDVTNDPRVHDREWARDLGLVSFAGYQLRVPGAEILGVLALFAKHPILPAEDALLDELSSTLAQVVQQDQADEALRESEESLRAQEVNLLAAEAIQARLWPKAPPVLPSFDIAGAVYPAEYAAGDYFDYLLMPDGSIVFVIGDVAGHGLGPAIVMALLYAHLRSLVQMSSDSQHVLSRLNQFLVTETEHHVTLLFGRLHPSTRSLVAINAGHPPGYVLDRFNRIKAQMESTTIPLGIGQNIEFPSCAPVTLEPGDLVVLFTDGISEARSPEDTVFTNERMLEVVRANRDRSAAEIIKAIIHAVQAFCHPEEPYDDMAAIVIKVGPGAEAPSRA